MFKKKARSGERITFVAKGLNHHGDGYYEGTLTTYGGREYSFAWDDSVGMLWLHDAAESHLPESEVWQQALASVEESVSEQKLSTLTDVSRYEQSIRVDRVRGKLARGSQRREVGVTKSTGLTVYYSLDQVRFVAYYKRDGGPINLSPELINAEIIEKRNLGDPRKFVAIIEGGYGTLAYYQDRLTEPEFVVYVSNLETLQQLGVKSLDSSWTPGQPQISLNAVLSSRLKKKDGSSNPLDNKDILADDTEIILSNEITDEQVEGLENILLRRKPKREVMELPNQDVPSTNNQEPEVTELVEIIKRQPLFSSVVESDFIKESPEDNQDPEDPEEDEIVKNALAFLEGEVDDESN
jgi:hypothetical protein